MKKLLSFLLAIILIVSVVPMGAFSFNASAADTYTEGYYTYTVENGEATITGRNGPISGDIIIPDTLGGYPVTSIGEYAFCRCINITSVIIPNSVTSIGDSAFFECYSLTSITIPDSVISIADDAFFCYGEGLTEINVSEANQYYCDIDGVLFDKAITTILFYPGANKNTAYTIPYGVTNIGEYAFSWCNNLTSITIPNSVTSIGDGAFYMCEKLTNITIPDSVTSIGDNILSYCNSLTEIPVDEANRYYCSVDGVLFDKDKTTIIQYPIGKTDSSYIIPDSVTNIGDYEFESCNNLTSVVIPDSVTSIGDYAFYHCNSLTSITIPDSVTSIGNSAFFGCSSLTSITIPDSVTSIGNMTFYDCTNLTSVFYRGSEEQKENIVIAANNETLANATWYYNSCIGNATHTEGEPVIENNIDATCTEDGSYDSVVYCSVCDDELSRETVTIDALGHEFPPQPDVIYPGCGDDGWEVFDPSNYYYTCIRCGYFAGIPYEPIVPAPGHTEETYIENRVEATCVTSGSYEEVTYCTVCNKELSRNYVDTGIDSDNHINTQWFSIDSCTCKGEYVKCLDCGKIINEISIPVINHLYSETIVEPTCTQEGYTLYSCDRCGDSYVESHLSPTGHTYSNECDRDCNVCGEFRKAPHKYDNACDDECDVCGTQRDVEGHIYDNDCDRDCNICGDTRDVTHIYDNVCDADCNICGATRVNNHSYGNNCDIDCNICGFIRTVEHVFTNECDGECDLCFDTRKAPHKYANACDSECDLCGKTRSVLGHVYDDENDTVCNVCGVDVSPSISPMFVVSSAIASTGETIKITISTKNNPGIIFLSLEIGYDDNALKLLNHTEGDFKGVTYGPKTKNPFIVTWGDPLKPDNNTNGVIATLEFEVLDTAPQGKSEITVTPRPDNVFNSDMDAVHFDTKSGYVTIHKSGDANGDGKINGKDYALLLQSINGWDVTINSDAADVNGDGKLNGKDYALLLQRLNGWNV